MHTLRMVDGECELFEPPLFLDKVLTNLSHVEGKSTVFGTGLNYCTLRLLGVDAEHPVMVKARGTLHKLGETILIVPLRV